MGELKSAGRDRLPDSAYAFPEARKEPLTDPAHVRNAAARFNQVNGVSAAETRTACKRIEKAAGRLGVELSKPPD